MYTSEVAPNHVFSDRAPQAGREVLRSLQCSREFHMVLGFPQVLPRSVAESQGYVVLRGHAVEGIEPLIEGQLLCVEAVDQGADGADDVRPDARGDQHAHVAESVLHDCDWQDVPVSDGGESHCCPVQRHGPQRERVAGIQRRLRRTTHGEGYDPTFANPVRRIKLVSIDTATQKVCSCREMPQARVVAVQLVPALHHGAFEGPYEAPDAGHPMTRYRQYHHEPHQAEPRRVEANPISESPQQPGIFGDLTESDQAQNPQKSKYFEAPLS
mmetsp:Transcript_80/g.284  ORF Transcript_80/g.284 Transcript_80/m.284 type:complete len:270 (+) Transcript_80:647-1456(+)